MYREKINTPDGLREFGPGENRPVIDGVIAWVSQPETRAVPRFGGVTRYGLKLALTVGTGDADIYHDRLIIGDALIENCRNDL